MVVQFTKILFFNSQDISNHCYCYYSFYNLCWSSVRVPCHRCQSLCQSLWWWPQRSRPWTGAHPAPPMAVELAALRRPIRGRIRWQTEWSVAGVAADFLIGVQFLPKKTSRQKIATLSIPYIIRKLFVNFKFFKSWSANCRFRSFSQLYFILNS